MGGGEYGQLAGGGGSFRATGYQRSPATKIAAISKERPSGPSPALGRIMQISSDTGPGGGNLDLHDDSSPSAVEANLDSGEGSTFAAFFNEMLNFDLLPDAPRPLQAASSGCETKNGALS